MDRPRRRFYSLTEHGRAAWQGSTLRPPRKAAPFILAALVPCPVERSHEPQLRDEAAIAKTRSSCSAPLSPLAAAIPSSLAHSVTPGAPQREQVYS